MLFPKVLILLLDSFFVFAQIQTGKFTHQKDVPLSTSISVLTETSAPLSVNTLTYCALQCRLHPLCNVIELCHQEPDVVCRLRRFPNPTAVNKNDKGLCQYYPLREGSSTEENLQNVSYGSCMEVKKRIPSAGDGEYWLYPEIYKRQQTVRIYCNNMTGTPLEYLTISNSTNYIVKHVDPVHNYQGNPCTRDYSVPLYKVFFSKVRLNITNMKIVKDDFTFTHATGLTNAESIGYGFGEAHDCTGPYYTEPCTRFGSLSIDLKDTGFAIDPAIKWTGQGHLAKVFQYTHSADGLKVFCLVGGYCGLCLPNATITLTLLSG